MNYRTFIEGGPQIPQEILEAQENGELVFFCGAGISYQAELKGFAGLTTDLYQKVSKKHELNNKKTLEGREFKEENYDRVLGYLEDDWSDFRKNLDDWGKNINENQLSNHEALIKLSTSSDRKVRLVTTNFDTGFVKACEKNQYQHEIDSAPKLPVPKKYKWNSIVHLHGLSGKNPQNIVITSADFGAAYLTEGWAAKFVTELFYEFTILFIGYSLSDPVLRYLTDAIAADKKRSGKKSNKVYALVEATNNEQTEYLVSGWEAKNVKAVLYDSNNEHSLLYETLQKWAGEYSSGITGIKQICAQYLRFPPQEDDQVTKRIRFELLNRRKNIQAIIVPNRFPHQEWWFYLSKEDEKLSINSQDEQTNYTELVNIS